MSSRERERPTAPAWDYAALFHLDTAFLEGWDDLERVLLDGQRLSIMIIEQGYEEIDLVTFCLGQKEGQRRGSGEEEGPRNLIPLRSSLDEVGTP